NLELEGRVPLADSNARLASHLAGCLACQQRADRHGANRFAFDPQQGSHRNSAQTRAEIGKRGVERASCGGRERRTAGTIRINQAAQLAGITMAVNTLNDRFERAARLADSLTAEPIRGAGLTHS